MKSIAEAVDSLGGMAQKQQLVRLGATDRDLTYAYQQRWVIRARNGWYSTKPENSPEVRAVRVGGRLTGISALIAMGAWVLDTDQPLHVSVHDNAARLRSQINRRVRFDAEQMPGVVLHWDAIDVAERGTAVSVGLTDALFRVIVDEPLEVAVACLDWALHTRVLRRFEFRRLIRSLPVEYRYVEEFVDGACESLPESLSKTRLKLRGHRVTTQVRLPDGKRIDLVVDDIVGLETDGREFHVDAFEIDRSKDIDIILADYLPMRVSAHMVFHDWNRFYLAMVIVAHSRSPHRQSRSEIQEIVAAAELRAATFRHPPTREERKVLNFRQSDAPGGNSPQPTSLHPV